MYSILYIEFIKLNYHERTQTDSQSIGAIWRIVIMQNKEVKNKKCESCIHENACQMWNMGTIHNANATNCANYELIKESNAYFLGVRSSEDEAYSRGCLAGIELRKHDLLCGITKKDAEINKAASNPVDVKTKGEIIIDKFCYSNDGEQYYGKFDTEKDAIDDAKENHPEEESVYIGTCYDPDQKWRDNADSIIESMTDYLDHEVGEAAENFEVSEEQEAELARMINETVKDWIAQEHIEPQCYGVKDEHIVLLNHVQ